MYLHFALGWLYKSDLDVLVEELGALRNKWRALGEALHLSKKDLEAISTQHSHTEDCLKGMLINWLQLPGAMWHVVIDAVRKVGEDGEANRLKVKYGESATTVISLILLACDNMGNCGMELIFHINFDWEECNSTQLHLALFTLLPRQQILPSILGRHLPKEPQMTNSWVVSYSMATLC